MIIPVRCFTCGKVLANKWKAYQRDLRKLEEDHQQEMREEDKMAPNFDPILRGQLLDKLHIERICCRRHMLSHSDIIDII